MKKIIFECVGNAILFILLGLALLFPFSDSSNTTMLDPGGYTFTLGVMSYIFLVYGIAFALIRIILSKKTKWMTSKNSELSVSDEREKSIRNVSVTMAYKILMFGTTMSAVCIGGFQFFILATGVNWSIYDVSVVLLVLILVITTVSYCIRWCVEYKR